MNRDPAGEWSSQLVAVTALLVPVVLAACGVGPSLSAAPSPTIGAIDAACRFPAGTAVAWSGETSLRAIGIEPRPFPGPEPAGATLDDPAMVWITRDPVELYLPSPQPSQPIPFVRAFCALYPPHSGVGTIVVYGELPAGWEPPQ